MTLKLVSVYCGLTLSILMDKFIRFILSVVTVQGIAIFSFFVSLKPIWSPTIPSLLKAINFLKHKLKLELKFKA